jgi:hypothetical protein
MGRKKENRKEARGEENTNQLSKMDKQESGIRNSGKIPL